MSANLDDYYLDSKNNKFELIKNLVRTKGSSQIHFWTNQNETINNRNIEQRRSYQLVEYKNKEVFVKIFKAPNRKGWDIKKSIRYQAENLYFLINLPYVPELVFFTGDSIGMEYIPAQTLKEYINEKRKTKQQIDELINDIEIKARCIIQILNKYNRLYDLSYNNIIVKDNKAYFVDFDYSDKQQPIDNIIKIIKDVYEGKAIFTQNGCLLYPKSLTSRFKYYLKMLIRK